MPRPLYSRGPPDHDGSPLNRPPPPPSSLSPQPVSFSSPSSPPHHSHPRHSPPLPQRASAPSSSASFERPGRRPPHRTSKRRRSRAPACLAALDLRADATQRWISSVAPESEVLRSLWRDRLSSIWPAEQWTTILTVRPSGFPRPPPAPSPGPSCSSPTSSEPRVSVSAAEAAAGHRRHRS